MSAKIIPLVLLWRQAGRFVRPGAAAPAAPKRVRVWPGAWFSPNSTQPKSASKADALKVQLEGSSPDHVVTIRQMLLQSWAKKTGQRIVILFEGRDAAGKGGSIRRFMEHRPMWSTSAANARAARCSKV